MIPEYLRNTILKDYSNEEYESIVNGYNSHRPVTLRINNLKTTKDNIINLLKDNNINYEEVSWYDNALILYDINVNNSISLIL